MEALSRLRHLVQDHAVPFGLHEAHGSSGPDGEVADLRPAGAGAPTPDTLCWNGRDRNGTTARAGVYIYVIKGEGKSMTGTVVVAK